jgi:hypothetical protein
MAISHKQRAANKQIVYNNFSKYILSIGKVVKVNDYYDKFNDGTFTSVPYFVRSFSQLSENDPEIHTKSAQRAGTLAAPIDIEFPIPPKKSSTRSRKLTTTEHVKMKPVPIAAVKVTDTTVPVDHGIDTVTVKVQSPGDSFDDSDDDWEEDRFFTDDDGIEFEGTVTSIKPAETNDWYKINKRYLTSKGYSDVVELWKFDDDHTNEYVAITTEGKVFHFIKSD